MTRKSCALRLTIPEFMLQQILLNVQYVVTIFGLYYDKLRYSAT